MNINFAKCLVLFAICFLWQNALSQEITNKKSLNDPEFLSCIWKQFGSRHFPIRENNVLMIGEVVNPTSILPSAREINEMSKSGESFISLTVAIIASGGLKENAHHKVLILREIDNSTQYIVADLEKIKTGETPDIDLELSDIVFIPMECNKFEEKKCSHENLFDFEVTKKVSVKNKVLVTGEVFSKTLIKKSKNLTLMQSIAMAGGFTKRAKSDEIWVLRKSKKRREKIIIDIKNITNGDTSDFMLQASDIVFVPKNCSKDRAFVHFKNFPKNNELRKIPHDLVK